VYKGVSVRALSAVKCEENASFIAVVLFPPAAVGYGFISVFIAAVFEGVIGDRNGQPILTNLVGQSARHRPRAQHPVFFEPQIEMRSGLAMVVQHEGRMLHAGHSSG
jgi:hypothetical protein